MIKRVPEKEQMPIKIIQAEPAACYDKFIKPVMSAEKVKSLLRIVWDRAYGKGFADRDKLDERLSVKK